jgi:hypothetical protein
VVSFSVDVENFLKPAYLTVELVKTVLVAPNKNTLRVIFHGTAMKGVLLFLAM